jgi:beta-galactosidase
VADGCDLAFIAVTVVDKDGRKVPTAGSMVRFSISGPGTIAALGNGDPTDHQSFQSDHYSAFHGECRSLAAPLKGRAAQSVLQVSRKAWQAAASC